ncbi:MAG: hypothetical protein Q9M44_02050, partial [Ghiorsea sp.]|nr:hypothetical protein [Ghiorsea sp.]
MHDSDIKGGNGVVCNVCQNSSSKIVARSKHSKNGDIRRCNNCDLTFVHPLPSMNALSETYDGLYVDRERFDNVDHVKQAITRKAFSGYKRELTKLGKEG